MAIQEERPLVVKQGDAHSPQIIANAFVHQYYYILQYSPELVHRFYCENSTLGRPEADGELSCITTMKAINEKIISLNCNQMPEINTIDAQASFGGGVAVLVTGNMTNQDGGTIKKNFTQSFFLAPQDKGYFVLNDMFRYMDNSTIQCGTYDFSHQTGTHLMQDKDIFLSGEQNIVEETIPAIEVAEAKNEAVYDLSENGEGPVVNEESVTNGLIHAPTGTQVDIESMKTAVDEELATNELIHAPTGTQVDNESMKTAVDEEPATNELIHAPTGTQVDIESVKTAVYEEIPKKSYASIVKVMKENISPLLSPAKNILKPVSAKADPKVKPAAQPLSSAPQTSAPNSITKDYGNVREAEAEGFSIYIKNLPMNATPAQLEVVFKRFGPIKRNGIQVRSHKHQGFCFGFVEFEVADAVQRAIEASPMMIGDQQAHIEGKRASVPRVNNRGRFVPGRGGGFRNGYYNGGGKGYARGGEFGNRGGRWGYQRLDNGGGVGDINGSGPQIEADSSNGTS